jgi:hypothetical protein
MLKTIKHIIISLYIIGMNGPLVHGKEPISAKQSYSLYKKAKKEYRKGNYIACQSSLKPLLEAGDPSLCPYSWFYNGLAAYRQGLFEEAKTSFLHIITSYPTWNQQDEALYWLVQTCFEQNDYVAALDYLQKIQPKKKSPPVNSLIAHYLGKADEKTVDTLRQRYPNNLIVAKAWLHQQLQLPYINRDTAGIQSVIQLLDLPHTLINPLKKLPSIKKDTYHIAIFFPFLINESDHQSNHTDFVLDLYRGIQAAVDRLYQQGIHLVLHPYDTKRNIATTTALLEKEEMKAMDLIIGPLYAPIIPLVAEFAKKNQIILFSPLSTQPSTVADNPFVYLLKPSLPTQVKAATNFTKHSLNIEQACIGVVYGPSHEDSLRANLYQQWIEEDTGKKIDLMLALDSTDAKQFLNRFRSSLSQPTPGQQNNRKILDSLTHIYIASQDELVITNVLSTIQIRKLQPTILLDEVCIKKDLVTVDQLQALSLFLVAPDYIDYSQTSVHNFRTDFYNQFGLYPSYYAAIGYDMMLFIGKMLFDYGIYFPPHWPEVVQPGEIFNGFFYGSHHDNQHIPIIQFKEGRFIVCNPIPPLPEDQTP